MSDRKAATLGEAGYERIAADLYETEPWVTQALLDAIAFSDEETIWEPACGTGKMARALEAAGHRVIASDLFDHGYGIVGWDFLGGWPPPPCGAIVTNPPFQLARKFIVHALDVMKENMGVVAMLQRHEFDAPISNHPLFRWPFAHKLILARRPKWVADDKASPRFPFAWYIWNYRHAGPPTILWPNQPDPRKTCLL